MHKYRELPDEEAITYLIPEAWMRFAAAAMQRTDTPAMAADLADTMTAEFMKRFCPETPEKSK